MEDCQVATVPTFPLNVNKPLVEFAQIMVPPATVPGTTAGSTVMGKILEKSNAQVPFFTTALYCVFTVGLTVNVAVVFVIVVNEEKLFVDDCHSTMPPI
jgi:hypothetical protein